MLRGVTTELGLQRKALALIAEGKTPDQAARATGASRRSVFRWAAKARGGAAPPAPKPQPLRRRAVAVPAEPQSRAVPPADDPGAAALPETPTVAEVLEWWLKRFGRHIRKKSADDKVLSAEMKQFLDVEKRAHARQLEAGAGEERYDFERLTTEELETWEELRSKARVVS